MKNLVAPRLISVLVLVAALALMLAVPIAAHADEPEDVWNTVSMEMYDLAPDREPTLVMSALVRDDIELPAEVAISIPEGAGVIWMGQVIDGTDPNSWPEIEDGAIEERDGHELVSFTLTDSRRAQLELTVPEGFVTEDDRIRTIAITWIAAGETVRARVGISTPHEYYLDDPTPEPLVGVRQSDIFYSVETSPVAEGDVLQISGTMLPGEAPELTAMREEQAEAMAAAEASAAAAATAVAEPIEVDIDTGFSIPTMWIILGLLGLGILVAVYFIYRNMQATSAEEPTGDDDDEAAGADDVSDDGEDANDEAAWGDVDMGDE